MNESHKPAAAAAHLAPEADALLRFWFGEAEAARPEWFTKNKALDAEVDRRFGAEIEAALKGKLDHWQASAEGSLALVMLLDQFTRNVFRGTRRAFAGDARALAVARRMVAAGQDQALVPLRRVFVYLPFEHAEDSAAQDDSVRLFTALAAPGKAGLAANAPHAATLANYLDYAERHRDVIRRFGRFPHRNALLGRTSTAQETEFLEQPGSEF